MEIQTVGSPTLWAIFIAFVLVMLAIDLGVFHRKAHEVSLREATIWSAVWVTLAAIFGAGVYLHFGPARGLEFAAGYLIEKALAVDNIFVFVAIFSSFAVPAIYQHRVLFWGVLGALVMRAAFIGAGAALLARFHWVMYVFGGILVLTAIKLAVQRDEAAHPERSALFGMFRRVVPATDGYRGSHFWVREGGKWLATPLFFVLVLVEVSDIVFAVDSIPAIFAVTSDPFIVFTSNVFAILGLRSMYFLLAGAVSRFHYIKHGLVLVLGFVGVKMLLIDVLSIPISVSLAVIATVLVGAVVASLWRVRRIERALERASVRAQGALSKS